MQVFRLSGIFKWERKTIAIGLPEGLNHGYSLKKIFLTVTWAKCSRSTTAIAILCFWSFSCPLKVSLSKGDA